MDKKTLAERNEWLTGIRPPYAADKSAEIDESAPVTKKAYEELRPPFPELERHCGSWIVASDKDTPVLETWVRRVAEEFHHRGYLVYTAHQWLVKLNKKIKQEGSS